MQSIKVVNQPKYIAFQTRIAYFNLPIILGLAVLNLFDLPELAQWIILGSVLVYFAFALFWMIQSQKGMNLKMSIEGDYVIIQNKSGEVVKQGKLIEIEYLVNDLDLDWKGHYKRMWDLLKGNAKLPSLQFQTEESVETVHFLIESFFHYNQLKNLQLQLKELKVV